MNLKRKRVYRGIRKARYVKKLPIDKTLILLVSTLLLFGFIAIYDATVILARDLYGNSYKFVLLQLAWLLVGLSGAYFFSSISFDFLKRLSVLLFGISVVFLALLAFFGVLPCSTNFIFGPCLNGANRWFLLNPSPLPEIPILGVLGFQPSEFAKLSLVLFLAVTLEKHVSKKTSPFVPFMKIVGVISGLILLQPNMSTAVLIFTIGLAMYFASGTDMKEMLVTLPVLGVFGFIAMVAFSHTRQRLLTFLSLGDTNALTEGYHIQQIQIALGSGGIFGVGLGQSIQKFQYLPEVFADSIFAIIGEEVGFLGTTALLLVFGMLIYKGYSIARDCHDLFGRLLAIGVTTWIGLQVFINIGAMTKLIPLTGIPLPLISYGGSSLVFILMGLGVLANVSRRG